MTQDRDDGVEGERRLDVRLGVRDLRRWSKPVARATVRGARAVTRRAGAYAALAVALAVGLLVMALATAAVIEIYDAITTSDGVAGLDEPLLEDLMGVRTPVMNTVLTAVTDTAGKVGMPVIAVVAMVALAVRRRSWTPVVLIAVTGTVSIALTVVGKELIGRVRPPHSDAVPPLELSDSFPSGHTLNAVAVIGVIAYLLALRRSSRRARLALAIGAGGYVLLIGFSRVYLGHHWFTDVLAGLVLGLAWLLLVITAHRFYLTAREQEQLGDAPSADDARAER